MLTHLSKIKLTAFLLPIISVMLNSCTVVGGIFKAGMGFGIFIVVAIIVAIISVVIWAGRRKS